MIGTIILICSLAFIFIGATFAINKVYRGVDELRPPLVPIRKEKPSYVELLDEWELDELQSFMQEKYNHKIERPPRRGPENKFHAIGYVSQEIRAKADEDIRECGKSGLRHVANMYEYYFAEASVRQADLLQKKRWLNDGSVVTPNNPSENQ